MQPRQAATTASILARGSVQRIRETVVSRGRDAWIAPVGDGWVLVLPDRPEPRRGRRTELEPAAGIDPYGLIPLGRQFIGRDCPQVLVFSVQAGLGVAQLISRETDMAFIGWRSDASGRPAGSRAEPDAVTFAARFGVPERAELLELLLDDHSGTPDERLVGFCVALGLPPVAVGATAADVAQERLHLPGVERQSRRSRIERWLGQDFSPGPWVRRTWVLRLLRLLLLTVAIPVLVTGWVRDGSWAHLLLGLGAVVALVASVAEIVGERRRSRVRWSPLRQGSRRRTRSLSG